MEVLKYWQVKWLKKNNKIVPYMDTLQLISILYLKDNILKLHFYNYFVYT